MGCPINPTGAHTGSDDENTYSNQPSCGETTQSNREAAVLQVDGADEYHRTITVGPARSANARSMGPGHHHLHRSQHPRPTTAQRPSTSHPCVPRLSVTTLLPYCTTGPPLSEAQVIAISDIAGSLQELVQLALGAVAGDAECVRTLENTVGGQAAAHIAEFFMDEWELDG